MQMQLPPRDTSYKPPLIVDLDTDVPLTPETKEQRIMVLHLLLKKMNEEENPVIKQNYFNLLMYVLKLSKDAGITMEETGIQITPKQKIIPAQFPLGYEKVDSC